MSVIAEFEVRSSEFELGRILAVEGISTIELESLVPVGDVTVPLFWIHNSTRESFIRSVRHHMAVNAAEPVDTFEDRTLFTLDWDANQDHVFGGLMKTNGQLLSAVGTADTWEFEVRFPAHTDLSAFTEHCRESEITVEATRVYNPASREGGPWFGLTEPQQEALTLAVHWGYYDIPRGCTTKELAAELEISDQAVTERLRRAIASLVAHTLFPTNPER